MPNGGRAVPLGAPDRRRRRQASPGRRVGQRRPRSAIPDGRSARRRSERRRSQLGHGLPCGTRRMTTSPPLGLDPEHLQRPRCRGPDRRDVDEGQPGPHRLPRPRSASAEETDGRRPRSATVRPRIRTRAAVSDTRLTLHVRPAGAARDPRPDPRAARPRSWPSAGCWPSSCSTSARRRAARWWRSLLFGAAVALAFAPLGQSHGGGVGAVAARSPSVASAAGRVSSRGAPSRGMRARGRRAPAGARLDTAAGHAATRCAASGSSKPTYRDRPDRRAVRALGAAADRGARLPRGGLLAARSRGPGAAAGPLGAGAVGRRRARRSGGSSGSSGPPRPRATSSPAGCTPSATRRFRCAARR